MSGFTSNIYPAMITLPAPLLERLRCPLSSQSLTLRSVADLPGEWLVTEDGQMAWPVENGFPVFLPDRVQRLVEKV